MMAGDKTKAHKRKGSRAGPAEPTPDRKRVKSSRITLASSFDTEVRPLIDLVDKLRGYGLDRDISLPAVAVIGDQSAGKSSVLEAISGVQLPRGTGIVTRCPLVMRMKHSEDEDKWEGKIMYTDKHGQQQEEVILNRESVGDLVLNAQDGMTDTEKGISDDLITLEVTSSDVPDLTLIDLPGIARNAAEGQPHDIEDRIKKMICDYIRRQETIILAVLQCNVDIAVCEALKMAREFDKKGRRTLGVLTKPDLLDKGAESSVMKIMDNMSFKLSKGYIIVKCRGQEAVSAGQSLTEALEDEDCFFNRHKEFSSLKRSQWGIPTLSSRLSLELQKHIKKLLPDLKEEVRIKLFNTDKELCDLGEAPPKTPSEKRQMAHLMVHDFIMITTAVTTGERRDDRRLTPDINSLYSDAREAFKNLYRKCVNKLPDINDRKLKTDLLQKIIASRGREFCNFMGKFELVESHAREYISNLEEPVSQCFDDVHKRTTDVVINLAEKWFGKFPDFAEKAKGCVFRWVLKLSTDVQALTSKDASHRVAEEFLKEHCPKTLSFNGVIMSTWKETQIECKREILGYFSMENLVYSQDETYSSQLRTEEQKRQATAEEGDYIARPVLNEDVNGLNRALMSLKSYCQVAARRLCDVLPMIIQLHVFQKKVRTVHDLLIGIISDDENLHLIQEEEDTARMRREIKDRYARLEKAERELEKI